MRILVLAFVLMTTIACQTQSKAVAGIANDISVEVFSNKMEALSNEQILDVRTPDECANGVIPGAVQINWFSEGFAEEAAKLDKEKPVLVYCAKGGRSAKAMAKLNALGFKEVYNLLGGFGAWEAAQKEIQK